MKRQAVIKLYAAKHNPLVCCRSVQEGNNPRNSLANVAWCLVPPFQGPRTQDLSYSGG
jgi:hypothetical protein